MTIEDVSVTFATGAAPVQALKDIDLTVQDGEFIALLGPSGCGKSTLLSCMGGLLAPTAGAIRTGSEVVAAPDPRRAAFVFQDYSLLPWATVVDNVAVGLRFAGVGKVERRAKAKELLAVMGLSSWESSHPAQLSGGMQQRVAVARALAMSPEMMLMDEPFGALDEQTRRSLGVGIAETLTANEQTVVLVTHSLDEAIFWADRVIVMSARPGRIVADVAVTAPRPRRLDFIAGEDFAALRSELFSLLTEASEASVGVGGHA